MSNFLSCSEYEIIASSINIDSKAFIDGKFVDSISEKTMDSINPATGKVIASVAACNKDDVNKAVQVARRTFESGVWSKMHPTARKKILLNFADILEKNLVELAVLEAMDSGKPIRECLLTDVPETIENFRWHAEFSDKLYGSTSPSGNDSLGLIIKEPIGVVACVLPWNYPLLMASWKLAPALSEGNSILLKPASSTALTALKMAKFAAEAGIPEGVFNVIPGPGNEVGEVLGMHPDIDVISFTGSTEVGRLYLKYSSMSNLKRIVLELGGKSPFVVLSDVKNYKSVAEHAVNAAFYNMGQNCTANSRIIVPNKRKEEFIDAMKEELKNWTTGNPMDPENKLGAIVTDSQFKTVMNYISKGQKEGATIAAGGKSLKIGKGLFIEPTIFDNVSPSFTIAVEEIFGPVTSVFGVDSDETALKLANNTVYGLQATLFTNDVKKAHQYAKELKAGTVAVNTYVEGDNTTPFGGYKLSGFGGKDKGRESHDQYVETKTIFMNLA